MTTDSNPYAAWHVITVGVSNLDDALALWRDQFGFSVVNMKEGDDPELAKLWSLQAGDIQRQALLRTNNSDTGMLHFVQFNKPDAPVREGAENFDLVPKNLDIYVKDLHSKVAELKAAGYVFRTDDYASFTAKDGMQFKEIQLPAHDATNVVLVEVVGRDYDFTNKGISGIGPFVTIVPDVESESDFYCNTLQTDKLKENVFGGPEIEKVVGLPAGTVLKIFILGQKDIELGQLELVEYQGVEGNNLYPRAKPKSLGVLHITYVVADASDLRARLADENVKVTEHGVINSMVASGTVLSCASPSGFKIEVYETL